ncbi:transcriptional regulator [Striga asiatica]|uniref:Transcriptional regulator n=1 Tax=Striga asiatica TaxID=4170 RepID=A0A5A7PMG2_STRAF|nr:transcriptional regulator [Striga asiatica]
MAAKAQPSFMELSFSAPIDTTTFISPTKSFVAIVVSPMAHLTQIQDTQPTPNVNTFVVSPFSSPLSKSKRSLYRTQGENPKKKKKIDVVVTLITPMPENEHSYDSSGESSCNTRKITKYIGSKQGSLEKLIDDFVELEVEVTRETTASRQTRCLRTARSHSEGQPLMSDVVAKKDIDDYNLKNAYLNHFYSVYFERCHGLVFSLMSFNLERPILVSHFEKFYANLCSGVNNVRSPHSHKQIFMFGGFEKSLGDHSQYYKVVLCALRQSVHADSPWLRHLNRKNGEQSASATKGKGKVMVHHEEQDEEQEELLAIEEVIEEDP